MAMSIVSNVNTVSMVRSSYFYFTKARFFAGLFYRASKPVLPKT